MNLPEDDEDFDPDIAPTMKFASRDGSTKTGSAIKKEARPQVVDDDFDGMDRGGLRPTKPALEETKQILIPQAKNRIKLQPIGLAPLQSRQPL